jgi:hypothetical protein
MPECVNCGSINDISQLVGIRFECNNEFNCFLNKNNIPYECVNCGSINDISQLVGNRFECNNKFNCFLNKNNIPYESAYKTLDDKYVFNTSTMECVPYKENGMEIQIEIPKEIYTEELELYTIECKASKIKPTWRSPYCDHIYCCGVDWKPFIDNSLEDLATIADSTCRNAAGDIDFSIYMIGKFRDKMFDECNARGLGNIAYMILYGPPEYKKYWQEMFDKLKLIGNGYQGEKKKIPIHFFRRFMRNLNLMSQILKK